MDIKRKTFDIRTWRKLLYLDLSSASIDTLLPSFYQCVETRTSVSTSSSSAKPLPPSGEPLYVTNTSHRKQETFPYEYPLHCALFPTKKKAKQDGALRQYTPQARSPF
jgi:hypothetical protein